MKEKSFFSYNIQIQTIHHFRETNIAVKSMDCISAFWRLRSLSLKSGSELSVILHEPVIRTDLCERNLIFKFFIYVVFFFQLTTLHYVSEDRILHLFNRS